jgi:hypothetical protein
MAAERRTNPRPAWENGGYAKVVVGEGVTLRASAALAPALLDEIIAGLGLSLAFV